MLKTNKKICKKLLTNKNNGCIIIHNLIRNLKAVKGNSSFYDAVKRAAGSCKADG